MFFSVREPEVAETPVVVEVPHAGLEIDPVALATLVAPARCIGQDADLYVDELYADAPAVGATMLVAHASRYVCDLNRSEDDVDALTVEGGGARSSPHGLIWRQTTENAPAIAGPLPRAELERRLTAIYRPYHATLRQLIEDKRRRFGFAVVLSGHSMPGRGRPGHTDPGRQRADVVPGSRGRTTAALAVVRVPDELARDRGMSVSHDDPYRGGYTTGLHGKPEENVHVVQVELARRLYMHEATLEKKPSDFEATRAYCRALVARLGQLGLA